MLQVSDPHLSARRAYGVANFDAVARAVRADPPDLVVGTGDLALDDADDADDRRFARSRFGTLAAPWRVLPGNHDIGDTLPDPWMDQPITPERRRRWVDAWGPDWWMEEAEGWVLIGLDSLLFASDSPAEEEQWAWLAATAEAAGDRPVMLLVHKPLCARDLDEPDVNQTVVTPEGRRRLREALGPARVRLVASGHVHQ
ncbi:MAG TPA: metallophosphoesterase, partial [Acidimicrobiales bacterium]